MSSTATDTLHNDTLHKKSAEADVVSGGHLVAKALEARDAEPIERLVRKHTMKRHAHMGRAWAAVTGLARDEQARGAAG